jgi:hypothetical protein
MELEVAVLSNGGEKVKSTVTAALSPGGAGSFAFVLLVP